MQIITTHFISKFDTHSTLVANYVFSSFVSYLKLIQNEDHSIKNLHSVDYCIFVFIMYENLFNARLNHF